MAGAMRSDQFQEVLVECSEDELFQLVRDHEHKLTSQDALRILKNPFLSERTIRIVLEIKSVLVSEKVRVGLAGHRRTPEARALRLVTSLFWRNLLAVGADIRVRPSVRRAANRRLAERLPALAVGERMALARRAGQGLIATLRHDTSPRVIQALLENPRLTEGHLMPLVSGENSRAEVLGLLAENRKWGSRYVLRRALCRNPRTPQATVLRLLSSLKRQDLVAIRNDHRISAAVRRRAGLLSGEFSEGRGGISSR